MVTLNHVLFLFLIEKCAWDVAIALKPLLYERTLARSLIADNEHLDSFAVARTQVGLRQQAWGKQGVIRGDTRAICCQGKSWYFYLFI